MAGIGRHRPDLLFCAIEGEGEAVLVVHPELRVDLLGQLLSMLSKWRRIGGPECVSQVGERSKGGVAVSLHLDHGDRSLGERAVTVADGVVGVLPALVGQGGNARLCRRAVFDETVAVGIAVALHPRDRPFRRGEQRFDLLCGCTPLPEFRQGDDEQGRGIDRAVVGRPPAAGTQHDLTGA